MEVFNFSQARRQLRNRHKREFINWIENPGLFEGKETISAKEASFIGEKIVTLFNERLWPNVFPEKIKDILIDILSIEDQIVNEESRQPWNRSCLIHAGQTASITRSIFSFLESEALIHDIGRCFSHHPWIHGFAGENILEKTHLRGNSSICFMHLEAGAPLLGFTPENWRRIINASNFKAEIAKIPESFMIITLADMAKKEDMIVDPIQGVYHSGLRRLSEEEKDSLQKIDPSKISMADILGMKVEKLAMYLALCLVFDQQLKDRGIVFSSYLSEGERYYKEKYDF